MEKLPRTPKTTHGAKKRSAPTSSHLSKKTLKRSDSDPKSAHRGSGGNKNRTTPKKTHNPHNPIDNLGDHAWPKKSKGVEPAKKLKSAAKRVADKIAKSTMKGIAL